MFMNRSLMFLCTVMVLVLVCVTTADAHGYMTDPPSRQSLMTSVNPYFNGLNCGGRAMQLTNHGRCGVCGDDFSKPQPRDNEAGGKYVPANRAITRKYREGQKITVEILITASHGGYSEFRICPNNDMHTPTTQACLDTYLLTAPNGGTRLQHVNHSGFLRTQLVLPRGLTCSQCMLQWKWVTNNNCQTCGPQEEFYGCSDVSIVPESSLTMTSLPPTVTQQQYIGFHPIDVNINDKCTITALGRKVYGVEIGLSICRTQCRLGTCPAILCSKECRL